MYQNVYEYDLPLVVADVEPKSYRFIKPEESLSTNCWKESFKLLVWLGLVSFEVFVVLHLKMYFMGGSHLVSRSRSTEPLVKLYPSDFVPRG